MKTRRNTGLSISLTSFSSNSSSPVDAPDIDLAEKGRFLLVPLRADQEALPSPLLKHANEQRARQPPLRRLLALTIHPAVIFALLCGSLFVWRCVALTASTSVPHLTASESGMGIDLSLLPEEPTPFAFPDVRGQQRWAVSIPDNASFPLAPSQYRNICSRTYAVKDSIADSSHGAWPFSKQARKSKNSYYASDASYMDVQEAVSKGFLASNDQSPIAVVGADQSSNLIDTCERSLTFILESEEAGFGKALLSLWLSYGLALREKRAFFIEDSRWQYGAYMSLFPKPPQPSCAPPPASYIVPCPHQAAHLAVSAVTMHETFGIDFHEHFQSKHRSGTRKQRKIFNMARQGYEALFGLIGEDSIFSRQHLSSLREAADRDNYPILGVHIRRGDRHPFEYEFSHDYLPLERYTAAAKGTLLSPELGKSVNTSEPIPLLVASDDPDIIFAPELDQSDIQFRLERAQERIVLASKRNLVPTIPERPFGSAFVKHVDEVSGWEGGFFASLFRGLGRPNRSQHATFSSAREHRLEVEERLRTQQQADDVERELSKEEKQAEENAAALRQLVGRGYLLDLEVLSHSDAVVCAVSSATCRVLGVAMGWDAVRKGLWTNVDDGRGWSWDGEH